jgi:hypothetical protein
VLLRFHRSTQHVTADASSCRHGDFIPGIAQRIHEWIVERRAGPVDNRSIRREHAQPTV